MPPEPQPNSTNLPTLKNNHNIPKILAVAFFTILVAILLGVISVTVMFTGYLYGILFTPVIFCALWGAVVFLRKRKAHKGLIFATCLVISFSFIFLNRTLLSNNGELYYSIPPIITALSIYCIWLIYDYTKQHSTILVQTFSVLISGIILSVVVLGSMDISILVTKKLNKNRTQFQEEMIKKVNSETVSILNKQDSLILSSKGNPIGIRLQYSIYSKDKNLGNNFYFGNEVLKVASSTTPMATYWDLFTSAFVRVSANNTTSPKSGYMYDIVIYEIPSGLRFGRVIEKWYDGAGFSSRIPGNPENGTIELAGSCVENLNISGIEDVPIYYYYYPGGYASLQQSTVNRYNPQDFENTLIKEDIQNCW